MAKTKDYKIVPSKINPNFGVVVNAEKDMPEFPLPKKKLDIKFTVNKPDGFTCYLEGLGKEKFFLHSSHVFNRFHEKMPVEILPKYDNKGRALVCRFHPLDIDEFLCENNDDEFLMKLCMAQFYMNIMETLIDVGQTQRCKNIVIITEKDYVENLDCYDNLLDAGENLGYSLCKLWISVNSEKYKLHRILLENFNEKFPIWLWDAAKINMDARKYLMANPHRKVSY